MKKLLMTVAVTSFVMGTAFAQTAPVTTHTKEVVKATAPISAAPQSTVAKVTPAIKTEVAAKTAATTAAAPVTTTAHDVAPIHHTEKKKHKAAKIADPATAASASAAASM